MGWSLVWRESCRTGRMISWAWPCFRTEGLLKRDPRKAGLGELI